MIRTEKANGAIERIEIEAFNYNAAHNWLIS